MKSLINKVVLITGAGAGIGRATALAFAHAGARLALADVDEDAGTTTANMVQEIGSEALFLRADMSQATDVAQMVQATVAHFGQLDCAFNNAGIEGPPTRTADVTETEFDQILAVNLKGVWLCMKYEIQQMLRQGGGVIVNTASVAGLVGAHSMPAYAASKHGVIGLTKTAAVEYARKNIRVNAVCPAVIRTAMVNRALEVMPQLAEGMIAANPSRRLGEPEEVAAAVLWLCSDAASFTTGAALTIDGGLTAQ